MRSRDRLQPDLHGLSRRPRPPARYRRTHPNGPWIYTGGTAWEFQYVPGDEFPVFDTVHGKVGLAMCSEVYVPEVARALALRGAELIFMPAGKDKNTLWATWRTLIWARAIENLALVVTTQNLFDHGERGLAMVAAPEEIMFESTAAGMTVVDVDLARVRYLRIDTRRGRIVRQVRRQAGPAWPAMAAAGALRRISIRGRCAKRRSEFGRACPLAPILVPGPVLAMPPAASSARRKSAPMPRRCARSKPMPPRAGTWLAASSWPCARPLSGFDPLFERGEAHALGAVTHRPSSGSWTACRASRWRSSPRRLRRSRARDDFEISDLRTIAVRGMVDEEHLPPLAEGKSLLIWHSRRRFCSNCGARDTLGRCRMAARLRELQDAALPAHRPRRHHAGDRRRALPARPLRALRDQFLVVPGGFRRARRDHRRGGAARSPRGGRHRLRPGEIFPLAAVAVSVLADDRLPCAGAVARARGRSQRA